MSNVTPIGPHVANSASADDRRKSTDVLDVIADVASLIAQARAVVDAITERDESGCDAGELPFAVGTLLDLASDRLCQAKPPKD